MKDFIKKYQNHKLLTNLNIILASLVLAVGINFFLVDGTNIGQSLKASVLNSQIGTETADVYLKKIDNDIYLVTNKNIVDLNNFSISFSYNPENVEIFDISSQLGQVANLGENQGINSIILNIQSPVNLNRGDNILKVGVNKKIETTENLNILNANFSDSENNQFLLSTSGITF
ncbi:MAG: hypothetical protein PHS49_04945 [Candidatus Gracilibacteria bacterium]|nr:hypothetical protein [Candidatus Gracilibacteria bacterium]